MTIQSVPQLTRNEQSAVQEYLDRIHTAFPGRIFSATLFGSKVRGGSDPESDVDLLLVVDTESWQFRSELWRMASDVSLEYNVVISVRVFGQDRWSETRRLRLPLYRAIATEGVSLTRE